MDVQNIGKAPAHARRFGHLDHVQLVRIVEIDDARGHDHQKLGSVFCLFVESEQGTGDRDVCKPWNPLGLRGAGFGDQPADDNRLAVVGSHSRLSDRLIERRGQCRSSGHSTTCNLQTIGPIDRRAADGDNHVDQSIFVGSRLNLQRQTCIDIVDILLHDANTRRRSPEDRDRLSDIDDRNVVVDRRERRPCQDLCAVGILKHAKEQAYRLAAGCQHQSAVTQVAGPAEGKPRGTLARDVLRTALRTAGVEGR